MEKNYYKITITKTGRNSLKEEPHVFDEVTILCGDLDTVKAALIDHYGKMPGGRKKIYIDGKNGGGPEVVGFLHSFWNRDISHNSDPWYQTDWIEITNVIETAVMV